MKKLLSLLLLFMVTRVSGQVIADPAVSTMRIFNAQDVTLNPQTLALNSIVTIKVPIFNLNLVNGLPSGSCKIKLGLGSKIELDPSFDLSNANTSSYFHWTSEISSGQVQVTGDLFSAVPPDFNDTLLLRIRGKVLGSSTITNNFLITNHNTTINLSDENGNNNTSFLPYTIVAGGGPVPVTITKLEVKKKDCVLSAALFVENEINVSYYDLELSTNGTLFEKKATVPASNLPSYNFYTALDNELKNAARIFVRIKAVDLDGTYKYSIIRQVAGGCASTIQKSSLTLFPNPASVSSTSFVTIKSAEAAGFNGTYSLYIYTDDGKMVEKVLLALSNADRFNYRTAKLPAGVYILKLSQENGTDYSPLKLIMR